MYTPIIHNLTPGDLGYNEAQRLWKAQCDDAYNAVKQSVGA